MPAQRMALISIHASTQEATLVRFRPSLVLRDFNPRLHAGGDECFSAHWSMTFYFNPRLHAGSDNIASDTVAYLKISIHASTQEATQP